jgi:hypothetical protein
MPGEALGPAGLEGLGHGSAMGMGRAADVALGSRQSMVHDLQT